MQPETLKAEPSPSVPAIWDGILCSALVVTALLVSRPFVEIGMIDDFSYVKTTFVFAQTGHFVYNGWATAMLGWQIVWGALFVKLFGYTFTATRISTIVIAACCVALVQAILVRGGVNRRNAIFGALATGLSPLFIPLAVTYMTDISGLFVILLCLYCCMRAVSAVDDRAMIAWLIGGAAAGTVGGTARQIAWLSALVMVPSAAWILRKRRGAIPVGVLLWLLSAAAIYASLQWFKHQPYSVPEPILTGRIGRKVLRELLNNLTAAALCLALLAMPVIVGWLKLAAKFRPKVIAIILVATPFATAIFRYVTFHNTERGFMPWTGDVLDRLGIFDTANAWILGVSPATFTFNGRVIGSVIAVGILLAFGYAARITPIKPPSENPSSLPWSVLLTLIGPFSCAYIVMLMPRGLIATIIDRYVLPLLVMALLCLLRLYQEQVSPRLPAISYAVLVLFGSFAVCGTHDWCESHRARLAAINRIHATGIPLTQIEGGYEFDGITQIDTVGVVIDSRVTYPPGIEVKQYAPPGLPAQCVDIYNPHTPAIHATYFIAFQKVPCLNDSEFGSVPYRTWLPPFQRQIAILKLP